MSRAPRTLRSRLAAVWSGFWLVPAAFAAGAVLLALGLSVAELRLGLPTGGFLPSSVAGARSLLSSIITAMISFTALVFSITGGGRATRQQPVLAPGAAGPSCRTGSPRAGAGHLPGDAALFAWWCWRRCRPTPRPGLPELSLAVTMTARAGQQRAGSSTTCTTSPRSCGSSHIIAGGRRPVPPGVIEEQYPGRPGAARPVTPLPPPVQVDHHGAARHGRARRPQPARRSSPASTDCALSGPARGRATSWRGRATAARGPSAARRPLPGVRTGGRGRASR